MLIVKKITIIQISSRFAFLWGIILSVSFFSCNVQKNININNDSFSRTKHTKLPTPPQRSTSRVLSSNLYLLWNSFGAFAWGVVERGTLIQSSVLCGSGQVAVNIHPKTPLSVKCLACSVRNGTSAFLSTLLSWKSYSCRRKDACVSARSPSLRILMIKSYHLSPINVQGGRREGETWHQSRSSPHVFYGLPHWSRLKQKDHLENFPH